MSLKRAIGTIANTIALVTLLSNCASSQEISKKDMREIKPRIKTELKIKDLNKIQIDNIKNNLITIEARLTGSILVLIRKGVSIETCKQALLDIKMEIQDYRKELEKLKKLGIDTREDETKIGELEWELREKAKELKIDYDKLKY